MCDPTKKIAILTYLKRTGIYYEIYEILEVCNKHNFNNGALRFGGVTDTWFANDLKDTVMEVW